MKFREGEVYEAKNIFCEGRKFIVVHNKELVEIGETTDNNFRILREYFMNELDLEGIVSEIEGMTEIEAIEELLDED